MKKRIKEFYENASWLKEGILYHRGKHSATVKENTFKAIEEAIKDGLAIEIDVRLSKDNEVVLSHDNNLKRVFGIDKNVSELSYEEIKVLTNGEVPRLKDVLELVDDKIGLMVEVKAGKIGLLEEKVIELLNGYKGRYVVVCFNPRTLRYFRKKAPHIIRGQLSYSYKKSKRNFALKYILSHMLFNFLSQPHFISYGIDGYNKKILEKYRKKGYFIIGWTYKDEKEKKSLKEVYDNMIMEDLSIKEF